mmetsp:Transcript_3943/g.14918  ORF Transcript_3943/g.14918 Transcript_3943/m.14918 type:complete len:497 (-) Transcript_3943:70-1560(-)
MKRKRTNDVDNHNAILPHLGHRHCGNDHNDASHAPSPSKAPRYLSLHEKAQYDSQQSTPTKHSKDVSLFSSPTTPQLQHPLSRKEYMASMHIARGPYGHYALHLDDIYEHLFTSPSSGKLTSSHFSSNPIPFSDGSVMHQPKVVGKRAMSTSNLAHDKDHHFFAQNGNQSSLFKWTQSQALHSPSSPHPQSTSNSITIKFRGRTHSFDPRDTHLGATHVHPDKLKQHVRKCNTHLSTADNIGVRLKSMLPQLPTDHYQLIVRRGYSERQYLAFLHPLRMTTIAKRQSTRVAECSICRVPMYHTDLSFRNAEEQHVHMKIHVENCRKLALSRTDLARYKRLISDAQQKTARTVKEQENSAFKAHGVFSNSPLSMKIFPSTQEGMQEGAKSQQKEFLLHPVKEEKESILSDCSSTKTQQQLEPSQHESSTQSSLAKDSTRDPKPLNRMQNSRAHVKEERIAIHQTQSQANNRNHKRNLYRRETKGSQKRKKKRGRNRH